MSTTIRLATADDLEAINAIYNHYVSCSTCTYQEEPEPIEGRRVWFDGRGPQHPVTVAVLEGEVIGWGSLSPYHSRCAYRRTAESSLYLDHRFHRRGIGRLVLTDLIVRAKALGHHTLIAAIDSGQTPSILLHERQGFEQVGRFYQVGYKFGRWLDVIYMQKML